MTSLVRNSALDGFGALVHELGGEPGRLLAVCGIPTDIETQEDAFLSYRALIALLELCAERLHCPDFGMRLARLQGMEILGPLAVVIRHAATVAEAIEQAAKYLHVFNPGQRITVRRDGAQVCLRFQIVLDNVPYTRQANERALVFLKRTIELGGDVPPPRRVLFSDSRLASLGVYREVFGTTELHFEQAVCGLDIDAATMQASLHRSNRHIRSMAIAFLEQTGGVRERQVSMRVREICRRLLPARGVSIDLAAEYLNLNRRTLQRRLVAEGTSFSAVLDDVRADLASRYLAERDLPLSHVAALLGYTEQSAFNRACRRWFAATPRMCREQILETDQNVSR
ncbi:AraC family transcriptional regulator [Salinisphaera dokdonensis]